MLLATSYHAVLRTRPVHTELVKIRLRLKSLTWLNSRAELKFSMIRFLVGLWLTPYLSILRIHCL